MCFLPLKAPYFFTVWSITLVLIIFVTLLSILGPAASLTFLQGSLPRVATATVTAGFR